MDALRNGADFASKAEDREQEVFALLLITAFRLRSCLQAKISLQLSVCLGELKDWIGAVAAARRSVQAVGQHQKISEVRRFSVWLVL